MYETIADQSKRSKSVDSTTQWQTKPQQIVARLRPKTKMGCIHSSEEFDMLHKRIRSLESTLVNERETIESMTMVCSSIVLS
jgi:hypothetical protein